VLSGFAWEASARLTVQVVSFVTTIFVARILSPADYGIVAVSGVFVGLFHIFTEFGLSQGLINKEEVSVEEESTIFWLSLIIAGLAFALIWIIAPFIERMYAMPNLGFVIRVSALALPLTSLRVVPLAKALRKLNFRYRAITEAMGQLVSAIVVVTLALNGYGLWSLVISYLISQLIMTIAYLPLLGSLPSLIIRLDKAREVINFGSRMMGANIIEYLVSRADVFIIGYALGQQIVGFYSMAFQLAALPLDKIGAMFNPT